MNVPETDETLLTAYALGELDGPERARVAALVEADPSARLYVEEVRGTADLVAGALEAELVDGLAQIEMGVIEQRLREQERDLARRRFQPASVASTTGLGQTRWLPFAASLAASVLIVCGVLAVLLPRLERQRAANTPGGNPVTFVGPQDGVGRPGLPGDDGPAPSPDGTKNTNEEFATNAAPGNDGELEWEPAEAMSDPGPLRAEPEARRREAELAARDAVVPAPPGAAEEARTPVPQKPAPGAGAVARGPARSPEAERVRPPTVSASPKARRPKTVNASPPRDPRAFKGIVKDAKKDDQLGTFENPFRKASERPRSSFPVRVETASYRDVRSLLLAGKRPPAKLVRIEEMLNRFAYADPAPAEGGPPVAASVEVKTCPWNVRNRLARVAIRARDGGATVVAKGVDASIEFDPDAVRSWRLIGYENARAPAGEPTGFATDLAAGGAATALYEINPTSPVTQRGWDPKVLFTLRVRYTDPHERASGVIHAAATDAGQGFDRASEDFRFAASVASFGMLLRDSQYKGTATYADVMRWAREGAGTDPTGERAAFIDLARAAFELTR